MMTTSVKKLTQSTAVAALGVAMVAAVGTAPASAVVLQEYNLNVSFGNKGSATGYYVLDKSKLPLKASDTFGVSLLKWDVSVKDALGNVLQRFFNDKINPSSPLANTLQLAGVFQGQIVRNGQPLEALSFTNTFPFRQLTLQVPAGFTGIINTNIADYVSTSSSGFENGTATSTPVPEPMTLAGTAVAGVMGLWMKRKQKASQGA